MPEPSPSFARGERMIRDVGAKQERMVRARGTKGKLELDLDSRRGGLVGAAADADRRGRGRLDRSPLAEPLLLGGDAVDGGAGVRVRERVAAHDGSIDEHSRRRLMAGIAIGVFFYGGLWITVRQLFTARHPVLLTLGKFLGDAPSWPWPPLCSSPMGDGKTRWPRWPDSGWGEWSRPVDQKRRSAAMHMTPDQIVLWHWRFVHLNATIVYTWMVMLLLTVGVVAGHAAAGSIPTSRARAGRTLSKSSWKSIRGQIREICPRGGRHVPAVCRDAVPVHRSFEPAGYRSRLARAHRFAVDHGGAGHLRWRGGAGVRNPAARA